MSLQFFMHLDSLHPTSTWGSTARPFSHSAATWQHLLLPSHVTINNNFIIFCSMMLQLQWRQFANLPKNDKAHEKKVKVAVNALMRFTGMRFCKAFWGGEGTFLHLESNKHNHFQAMRRWEQTVTVVGTQDKGYVRNIPLPRVPLRQSPSLGVLPSDYYEGQYGVPTYVTPRSLVESAAYAFSPRMASYCH